jgi:integrase
MTRKTKRRSIVEIGKGPATVKIYTINRKDGYGQFVLAWKECGRRKVRHVASMDEARMIAQQTTVRLTNGWEMCDEVTKRDLEMLRFCEAKASAMGTTLAVAIEEWVAAREIVGGKSIIEAVRFYETNRRDFLPVKATGEIAAEFVRSRQVGGMSKAYVDTAKALTDRFVRSFSMPIGEITVQMIDKFLREMPGVGPTTRNTHRRTIVTMFSFAKRQGYLHPDRKTAAQLSATYKVPDTKVTIFTPEEMKSLLLTAHARILPVIAIGGFAGIRTAEIMRLDWEDIKWDRGHIEISGKKAKTAARRLAPMSENLKAWLAPWRESEGPIVTLTAVAGAMNDLGINAKIPGGWRQNALRHSFISYRVAMTSDVPRTALEAGNSPTMIFRHYREIVDEEAAKTWFSITPPLGWLPKELPPSIRERLMKLSDHQGNLRVDTAHPA